LKVDALLGCRASDGVDFEAIENAVRRQVLVWALSPAEALTN
jgi:hypothetical protein